MAGDLKASGFHNLIPGPISVDYGPKGTTTHYTMTCDTIAPLIAYYNYIIQFGASGVFHGLDLGIDGITSAEDKRLEVSIPGLINNIGTLIDELFFDQWELLTNECTDTIFSNPLIVAPIGTTPAVLNDNDKVVLSRFTRDGGNVRKSVATCNADLLSGMLAEPITGGASTGGGHYVYQVPIAGVSKQIGLEISKQDTEYMRPTYVLRHTSYCSASSTYNTSTANTQKIYTTTQLLSEVGSGWTYNLPPRLYSKISDIATRSPAPAEANYYTWGWLKKITREPVLSNFIVEVNTEYELSLWSNLRYALR